MVESWLGRQRNSTGWSLSHLRRTRSSIQVTSWSDQPTLQNDWNSLRFGLSRHRGIITSAYMCLKANGVLSREYGHLLLHSYDQKKVFYGLGSGLRQNLSWTDFKYLPCLTPTPPRTTCHRPATSTTSRPPHPALHRHQREADSPPAGGAAGHHPPRRPTPRPRPRRAAQALRRRMAGGCPRALGSAAAEVSY